jgi:hypothetical protein
MTNELADLMSLPKQTNSYVYKNKRQIMARVQSSSISSQAKYEKQWLSEEMKGFSPLDSEAWKILTDLYGPKISKEEIVSLGQVAAVELRIDLVREYKRRKETMIKWFQNNITRVRPFLQNCVRVLGENDRPVFPHNATEE